MVSAIDLRYQITTMYLAASAWSIGSAAKISTRGIVFQHAMRRGREPPLIASRVACVGEATVMSDEGAGRLSAGFCAGCHIGFSA